MTTKANGQKKTPPTKKINTSQEKSIYVGPSTKHLPKYTVYDNGIPKYAEEHFKKYPALRALFVPVEKLTETQKNLEDPASAESIFYAKAKEYFEGVK